MSEQIEVTQADRDRAATMCVGDFTAEEFRARLHDDHFVVQNLAAHRIAAEQAAAATTAEHFAGVAEAKGRRLISDCCANTAKAIAKEIRASVEPTP
jgi:uncharacterized membrane protein YqiK